jgi:CMP-N-acetylneuraminic acid synthetase
MRSVSVVVNARIGSSRVKNKLLRPFANTSLIEIALRKLNKLDFFEHRYLAVAEQELKDLAVKYDNVEVLSRDMAAVKPGVNPQKITFAHYLEVPSDYIFTLNPCLPFITTETIQRAFEYFQRTDYSSYTSVIPTRDWIFDEEGNALTNSDPGNLTTNQGRVFFKAAHAFHIISKAFFRKHEYLWTFYPDDPHLIRIPAEEALDVDTEMDFMFVQYYYKQKGIGW